jgi:hypothetical protein
VNSLAVGGGEVSCGVGGEGVRAVVRVLGIWEEGGGVIDEVMGGAGEVNFAWLDGPGGSDGEAERRLGVSSLDISVDGTSESCDGWDTAAWESILQASTDTSEVQPRCGSGQVCAVAAGSSRDAQCQWGVASTTTGRREVAGAGARETRASDNGRSGELEGGGDAELSRQGAGGAGMLARAMRPAGSNVNVARYGAGSGDVWDGLCGERRARGLGKGGRRAGPEGELERPSKPKRALASETRRPSA